MIIQLKESFAKHERLPVFLSVTIKKEKPAAIQVEGMGTLLVGEHNVKKLCSYCGKKLEDRYVSLGVGPECLDKWGLDPLLDGKDSSQKESFQTIVDKVLCKIPERWIPLACLVGETSFSLTTTISQQLPSGEWIQTVETEEVPLPPPHPAVLSPSLSPTPSRIIPRHPYDSDDREALKKYQNGPYADLFLNRVANHSSWDDPYSPVSEAKPLVKIQGNVLSLLSTKPHRYLSSSFLGQELAGAIWYSSKTPTSALRLMDIYPSLRRREDLLEIALPLLTVLQERKEGSTPHYISKKSRDQYDIHTHLSHLGNLGIFDISQKTIYQTVAHYLRGISTDDGLPPKVLVVTKNSLQRALRTTKNLHAVCMKAEEILGDYQEKLLDVQWDAVILLDCLDDLLLEKRRGFYTKLAHNVSRRIVLSSQGRPTDLPALFWMMHFIDKDLFGNVWDLFRRRYAVGKESARADFQRELDFLLDRHNFTCSQERRYS